MNDDQVVNPDLAWSGPGQGWMSTRAWVQDGEISVTTAPVLGFHLGTALVAEGSGTVEEIDFIARVESGISEWLIWHPDQWINGERSNREEMERYAIDRVRQQMTRSE